MKSYIESILHQKVELIPCEGLKGLPLYLNGNYTFYRMIIVGQQCILAVPKEKVRLSEFRKNQKRIEQITGQNCVLYFNNMNYYSRDKMLEEGIPFIWENKQIYMPFLGILLQKNGVRVLPDCDEISFLTQKFLLSALYGKWDNMNVTIAAERMGVSKMSITRVFDEIESMKIPVLDKKGKFRRYIQYGTKKEIWEVIEPFLRSPLLKEYDLEQSLAGNLVKSGISALSEMSMLDDNGYQTYAVTKYEVKQRRIAQKRQVPKEETPGCIIQELGYCIPFKKGQVIDPLSIYLLLRNNMVDPRIEIAVEENVGGICVVKGIDMFREYFEEFTEQYVLIGGSACDISFHDNNMDFRATKDLDMVLVVEALTKEFAQRFWKFIQQGKYRNRAKGNGKPQFSVSINQENQIIQL